MKLKRGVWHVISKYNKRSHGEVDIACRYKGRTRREADCHQINVSFGLKCKEPAWANRASAVVIIESCGHQVTHFMMPLHIPQRLTCR